MLSWVYMQTHYPRMIFLMVFHFFNLVTLPTEFLGTVYALDERIWFEGGLFSRGVPYTYKSLISLTNPGLKTLTIGTANNNTTNWYFLFD